MADETSSSVKPKRGQNENRDSSVIERAYSVGDADEVAKLLYAVESERRDCKSLCDRGENSLSLAISDLKNHATFLEAMHEHKSQADRKMSAKQYRQQLRSLTRELSETEQKNAVLLARITEEKTNEANLSMRNTRICDMTTRELAFYLEINSFVASALGVKFDYQAPSGIVRGVIERPEKEVMDANENCDAQLIPFEFSTQEMSVTEIKESLWGKLGRPPMTLQEAKEFLQHGERS